MKNKEYVVLYQVGDKVLVEWCRDVSSFFPNGVEYSIHTEINDGLHWGHYFKDYQDATDYFIEKTKVDEIINTIIANHDEFEGTIDINEGLGYLALNNNVEEWFFDGDSYQELLKDYENLGIIKEYVSFEQYMVSNSLNW